MSRFAFAFAASVVVAAASVAPAGAFTFVTTPASQWGTTDAALGISGFTIENFEDTTLAPGLRIGRSGPVTRAPSATLLSNDVFNPLTSDPQLLNGQPFLAFRTGVWDGSNVLINNPGGSTDTNWYNNDRNWGNVDMVFSSGAHAVGFSIEQMERTGNQLLVNGNVLINDILGQMSSTTDTQQGFTFTGRNGYILVTAGQGETINTITVTSANTDGWAIDHLAFQADSTPAPEPASALLLTAAAFGLGAARRRR